MTHRYKIPAWVTEINFIWILPVVMPFLIYGYLRVFIAFAAIHIESGSEGNSLLAFFSLVIGIFVGAFASSYLDGEDVKWKWLARKDTP